MGMGCAPHGIGNSTTLLSDAAIGRGGGQDCNGASQALLGLAGLL